MNSYDIILFYKFAEIDDPEGFAAGQREFCKKEGLLGKILVAREGINGSFSGTREQIEKYKSFLTVDTKGSPTLTSRKRQRPSARSGSSSSG